MNEIEELLSEGKTKEAIECLFSLSESQNDINLKNKLILLKNRYYNAERLFSIGFCTIEEYNIALTKINSTILILNSDDKKFDYLKGKIFQDSNIEIVDIDFEDHNNYKIDIKVRNISKEIAYIKRGILKICNIYSIKPYYTFVQLSGVSPSGTYDFILPYQEAPFEIKNNISQAIKPNEVDRFTFSISSMNIPSGYHFAELEITLEYNTDNIVTYEDYLLCLLKDMYDNGGVTMDFIDDDCIKDLQGTEEKIRALYFFHKEMTKPSMQIIIDEYQKNFDAVQSLLSFQGKVSKEAKEIINSMASKYKG